MVARTRIRPKCMSVPGSQFRRLSFNPVYQTRPTIHLIPSFGSNQRAPFFAFVELFQLDSLWRVAAVKHSTLANILEYCEPIHPLWARKQSWIRKSFNGTRSTRLTNVGERNTTTNPQGDEPTGTAGCIPRLTSFPTTAIPGRVNINTIAGTVNGGVATSLIWNGSWAAILPPACALGPPFDDVVKSRADTMLQPETIHIRSTTPVPR